MLKNLTIVGLLLLVVGYFVADKPLVRVTESVNEDGKPTRVIISVIFGMGNIVKIDETNTKEKTL